MRFYPAGMYQSTSVGVDIMFLECACVKGETCISIFFYLERCSIPVCLCVHTDTDG